MRFSCGHIFAVVLLLSVIMMALGSRRDKRSHSSSYENRGWGGNRWARPGYGGYYGYNNQPYYQNYYGNQGEGKFHSFSFSSK
ncbi:hypothetical protein Q1695_003752 [Nippostrongylus brasiliensis]|nr:hypothetical protein Q1695_003752 [Nippostrongylus brasiliensis]